MNISTPIFTISQEDESKMVENSVTPIMPPITEELMHEMHKLKPIRILAYEVGLSQNPEKSWRYRDIKVCILLFILIL